MKVLSVIVTSLILLGPSVLEQRNQTRIVSNPRAEGIERRIFILVDPTILRDTQTTEFQNIADELGDWYERLPAGTFIQVVVIGKKAGFISPRLSEGYIRGQTIDRDETLYGLLRQGATKLNRLFRAEWEAAHAADRRNVPTTCIFSTLFGITDLLVNTAGQEAHLVLVSDLLEACNEWGTYVNFEAGMKELNQFPLERLGLIDLSMLDSVMIYEVPSQHLDSVVFRAALRKFWLSALETTGVSSDRVYWGLENTRFSTTDDVERE